MNEKDKNMVCEDTTLEPLFKKKKNDHEMAILPDRVECEMETNIHSLNDDCLIGLFAMLEFKDQINFADTCDRFNNLFTMYYLRKKKFEDLDLNDFAMDDSITLMEAERFLKIFGTYIKAIHCIQFNILPERKTSITNILELMPNFCPNINSIELHAVYLNVELLTKLFMKIKNVKKLSLLRCRLSDDCLLPIAEHLPNLEKLDISHNKSLVGEHLSKFHKLKELKIRECLNITSENFIKFCQTQTQLTSLDIQICEGFDRSTFGEMATRMSNLKCLKICNKIYEFEELAQIKQLEDLEIQGTITAVDFTNICQLQNLKILNFTRNIHLNDSALMKLTKLNLIELHITFCRKFSSDGLIKYLQHNPKLVLLNIRWCIHIGNELILPAIDVLRKQTDRTEPCKFIVGYTKITEDVLINNKNEPLISIDF